MLQSHGDVANVPFLLSSSPRHHAPAARPDPGIEGGETKGETKGGKFAMPDRDDDQSWKYDQMLMVNYQDERAELLKQREEIAERERKVLEVRGLEKVPEARDLIRGIKQQRLIPCESCYVPVATPKRRLGTKMDPHVAAALTYLRVHGVGEKKKCYKHLKVTFGISQREAMVATRNGETALKKEANEQGDGGGGEKAEENEGIPMGMFDPEDGVVCGGQGRHFLCKVCFNGQFSSMLGSEPPTKEYPKGRHHFLSTAGIQCLYCKREGEVFKYSDRELARNLSDKNLRALKEAVEMATEQKTRKEEKQRYDEEKRREALKSKEQREMERHRKYIEEEVMTLRCPKCRLAIFEYDACAALKCGQTKEGQQGGCGTAICAICLKDCGKNAHPHVREKHRDKTSDNYYFSKEKWDKEMCKIKQKRMHEYWLTIPEVSKALLRQNDGVKKIFKELFAKRWEKEMKK